MNVAEIAAALRASPGFAHKRDIGDVMARLPAGIGGAVALGDDCAAIPDPLGGGWLLFAIEGLVGSFVERLPWFAGWSGLMVNLSDIAAMGGRPIAVVDALWSRGETPGAEVLDGLAAASRAYGVPIVGGHSNHRSEHGQLAVAVLGRAKRLLTSFDARPGDRLVMAVDLRGAWQGTHAYWNAATEAPPERLRADLELLPALAEDGLCAAAKDISMAGAIGTALMLLECSGVGARIEIDRLPRPACAVESVQSARSADGAALLRWLCAFPSYGFVLAVPPASLDAVLARFTGRGIACAAIGEVTASREVLLCRDDGSAALLWHTDTPFITARRPADATATTAQTALQPA